MATADAMRAGLCGLAPVLGLGACQRTSQATAERPEAQRVAAAERPAIGVSTAVVEARSVQRSVETVGSLLAWDEVVAKSQATGTVLKLYADLGDTVRESQPLADLGRRLEDAMNGIRR
jgi:multidrug efflux pump subunit AcrA (membrane-fusion protein)